MGLSKTTAARRSTNSSNGPLEPFDREPHLLPRPGFQLNMWIDTEGL